MEIIVSPLAQWKIEQLLLYLETEWSNKSREKFLSTVLATFDQISEHPRSAPGSKEFPLLFKKVVTKQTSLFYRIKADRIEIIDLVDNRQNPAQVLSNLKKHFGER